MIWVISKNIYSPFVLQNCQLEGVAGESPWRSKRHIPISTTQSRQGLGKGEETDYIPSFHLAPYKMRPCTNGIECVVDERGKLSQCCDVMGWYSSFGKMYKISQENDPQPSADQKYSGMKMKG